MKAAFYAGSAGLIAQQRALDIIGNNIANVNTNGYQSQAVGFQQLLNAELYANTPSNPTSGYGVRADTAGLRSSSTFRQTGFMLDFAIAGDGFFAVQRGGTTQYTRDGAFALAMNGDQANLVTQDGRYVLNPQGGRITLGRNANGSFDLGGLQNAIGVYQFQNPSALDPASGNCYAPTQNSGAPTAVPNSANQLLQRVVETSGVSIADEMSDMISVQRAYQLSARVLQTSDENEQTVNNLRK